MVASAAHNTGPDTGSNAATDETPVVNSMAVEDTSLWADTDDGSFVFHDNRSATTNDPVPDAWNIYGQPLEFDAVTVYADGGVQVDIDTVDDSRATVSSALDPTVRYVIRLSSGDASVTVVHEGDIGDVKIVPDNAAEVREFHGRLAAGTEGTAVVSDAAPEPPDEVVNSMRVEDTSLWEDTDDGSFVFHDNRPGTTNDPVPEAWNIYGQPLEFDAATVYADGGVQIDIDTEDDSRASVSSALDPTVRYVIRLSSGDASVTVVHEGDIGDVKIVPDNAAEVREFHDRLAAGADGTAVVSDDPAPAPADEPDLVVESVSASDPSPSPGAAFTLSATVRNSGGAAAAATTLRYYRSENATISTSDTAVGTDAVGALSASATSPESISLNAPNTAGTYYYGACVDAVAGESDTADNCSAVRVDVQAPPPPTDEPDLVVESVSASDSAPQPGAAFTLRATVRNSGDAAAGATTLRYYRSENATISTSDTAVGTDAVGALSASATSPESISLNAPNTAGTYYYGACVDAVANESDTADNCSASVRVDVQAPPPPPPPPPSPSAPSLSLNETETHLEVVFPMSFAPRERKALTVRIRPRANLAASRSSCFSVMNNGEDSVTVSVRVNLFIRPFATPNTTYLVDYRHVGTSCADTPTAPWSAAAEFTTSSLPSDVDFDIDIVFVGPEPSASVKTAVNSAVSTWEQAITNDLADIDFSANPASNVCTDSEFDGIIDDLRIYVRVESIDGANGTLGWASICTVRLSTGFPVIARLTLDSADVGQLRSTTLYRLALHEIAHTLGFGITWNGLLVDPSLSDGQPVTPPPDTHFAGTNAIAAFDDAGGTNYQGNKVPVENEQGGQGAQDSHWRQSVMGSELMSPTINRSASFSKITIQSMADLGYSVDDGIADSYTVDNTAAQAHSQAAQDAGHRQCIVHPLTNVQFVPETRPATLQSSAIRLRVVGDLPGTEEPDSGLFTIIR